MTPSDSPRLDGLATPLTDAGLDPVVDRRLELVRAECPDCRAGETDTTGLWRPLVAIPRDGRITWRCNACGLSDDGRGSEIDRLANEAAERLRTEPPAPNPSPSGRTFTAESVAMGRQRWLWQGRFLLGSVSLLVGKEGVGKSTLAAWLAAQVTRGALPGQLEGEPRSVLIVASEDDVSEVWKPRLVLAEADLQGVHFLDLERLGPGWNIADGIGEVRGGAEEHGVALVLIDAILDHLPASSAGGGIRNPAFVRTSLDPLKRMARELNVCVPLGMHPPKGVRVEYRDMVQESQAFTAVARTGLLIAWHPEDEQLPEDDRRRVLLRGKGNYGRNPGGISFHISSGLIDLHDGGPPLEHGYVTNVEQTDLTMTDLAPRRAPSEEAPKSKAEQAREIVAERLADGEWHQAGPLCDELEERELGGKAQISRVKHRLGVETERRGFPAVTYWRLPAHLFPEGGPCNPQPPLPAAPGARADGPSRDQHSAGPEDTAEGYRARPWETNGNAANAEGYKARPSRPPDAGRRCARIPRDCRRPPADPRRISLRPCWSTPTLAPPKCPTTTPPTPRPGHSSDRHAQPRRTAPDRRRHGQPRGAHRHRTHRGRGTLDARCGEAHRRSRRRSVDPPPHRGARANRAGGDPRPGRRRDARRLPVRQSIVGLRARRRTGCCPFRDRSAAAVAVQRGDGR